MENVSIININSGEFLLMSNNSDFGKPIAIYRTSSRQINIINEYWDNSDDIKDEFVSKLKLDTKPSVFGGNVSFSINTKYY